MADPNHLGGSLNEADLSRYSRHLSLPDFGRTGQEKLRDAGVLLVGAGGLGSPVSLYLAAAGVGRLGIIDHDQVDLSNLQRQILFREADLGQNKATSAHNHLSALNSAIELISYDTAICAENALKIIQEFDLVVDGSDNLPTRYLVNDACVLLNKPYIYGSVYRFEGQASVFNYKDGPCYRCLHPEPPPPSMVPSCAEGGVLGVLPGMIAIIQATETIKLLTDMGDSLSGRLLIYDAKAMRFEEFRIAKNAACRLCGERAELTELVDYQAFCNGTPDTSTPPVPEITALDLKQQLVAGLDLTILDVRDSYERELCLLPSSLHIPLRELRARAHELDPAKPIVVYCKGGARAEQACLTLSQLGFLEVKNLKGGILSWSEQVDSSIARY